MKTLSSNLKSRISLLTAALFSLAATAHSADTPLLKEAYKDHFYIGVAVNRTIATGATDRADNVNRTLEEVMKDTALVKAQFNQIVPENDLKWALIHPREGADGYDFAPADAFVDFGVANNMYLVGHTLVWHGQTPNWVFQETASATSPDTPTTELNATGGRRRGRGITGPLATREQLLERMRDHIHTVVGRYKGKIKVWDVVNEAIADGGTDILRNSYWRQIIGPDFIAKAFEYAHEADPDAILRYNDYGLENQSKRRKFITLIKQLQEQKVPVMAIGSQAHVNVATTFDNMDRALTELETLDLPIHITEFDVNSARGGQHNTNADIANSAAASSGGLVSEAERRQADAYAGIFKAFVKHKKYVKVVTFWGANDGVSWLARGRPLLFDGNNQPKPAFDAVIRAASDADPNSH
jgi:endo-1,4-beta-xylanase